MTTESFDPDYIPSRGTHFRLGVKMINRCRTMPRGYRTRLFQRGLRQLQLSLSSEHVRNMEWRGFMLIDDE